MGLFKPQRGGLFPDPRQPLAVGLILDLAFREGGGPIMAAGNPPAVASVISSWNARLAYNRDTTGQDTNWPDFHGGGSDLSVGEPTIPGHGGHLMRFGERDAAPQGSDWALEEDRQWTPGSVPWHMSRARTCIVYHHPTGSPSFVTVILLPMFTPSDALASDPLTYFNSSNTGYSPYNVGSAAFSGNFLREIGGVGSGAWRDLTTHFAFSQPAGNGSVNAPSNLRVHVNGVETTHVAGSLVLGDNTTLRVGGDNSGGGSSRNYSGSISRIRCWDRQLSSAEVLREMAFPYEMYQEPVGLGHAFMFFPVDGDQNVAVATITAGTAILQPGVLYNQDVAVAAIAAGTAILSPTAFTPPPPNQQVAVGTITAGTAILAPDQVDRTVDVSEIAAGTTILAPAQIDLTVDVAAIPAGTIILAPGVSQTGDQSVSVGAITAGTAILAPDRVDLTVDVAAITAGTTILQPGVDQGADQSVSVGTITAGTTILAPQQIDRTLTVPTITTATAILAPATVDRTVDVGAVTAGTAILSPLQVDRTVDVASILAGTAILAPGLLYHQPVDVPVMMAGTTIMMPTVMGGASAAVVTTTEMAQFEVGLQEGTFPSHGLEEGFGA